MVRVLTKEDVKILVGGGQVVGERSTENIKLSEQAIRYLTERDPEDITVIIDDNAARCLVNGQSYVVHAVGPDIILKPSDKFAEYMGLFETKAPRAPSDGAAIHHNLTGSDFDILLKGFTLVLPGSDHSVCFDDLLTRMLQDHFSVESQTSPEKLGLVTDDDLCKIAARALQELKDRGYLVDAAHATPMVEFDSEEERPEPRFVVSITKRFWSDDTE